MVQEALLISIAYTFSLPEPLIVFFYLAQGIKLNLLLDFLAVHLKDKLL